MTDFTLNLALIGLSVLIVWCGCYFRHPYLTGYKPAGRLAYLGAEVASTVLYLIAYFIEYYQEDILSRTGLHGSTRIFIIFFLVFGVIIINHIIMLIFGMRRFVHIGWNPWGYVLVSSLLLVGSTLYPLLEKVLKVFSWMLILTRGKDPKVDEGENIPSKEV